MAAKKKAPAVPFPNRGYENGKDAWGAKFVRPGFALTPQLDLEYALGRGSGFAPTTLLPDIAPGKKIKWAFNALPRNVVIAEVRQKRAVWNEPVVPQANPDPLTDDEARTFLREGGERLIRGGVITRAIEAMVGTGVALPAYLDGLEAMKKQTWQNGSAPALSYPLYGMLLRSKVKDAEAARKRVEKLYEKIDGTQGSIGLNILLNGKQGIAEDGYKYSPIFKSYLRRHETGANDPASVGDLLFLEPRDADFVCDQFAALWTAFKFKVQNMMNGPSPARLFFLGGDRIFETELKVVMQYPGTRQKEALESYVDFRSPGAARCVLRLTHARSKVIKEAQAWLEAQRDWVKPLVSTWAKSGEEDAALAKALL
ncbi:MAG: hypothetical protein JNM17_37005 [Archangium sp.]|nr:hypothetical protein [Archangium sp.]